MMRVYFRGKRSYYHCTKDKLNTYPPLENAPFAAAVRRAGCFVWERVCHVAEQRHDRRKCIVERLRKSEGVILF